MFTSPCTLRSTQCAALIALAAAAGIARIETAHPVAGSAPSAGQGNVSELPTATRLIIFELASHASAPWARRAAAFAAFIFTGDSVGHLTADTAPHAPTNHGMSICGLESLVTDRAEAVRRVTGKHAPLPLCTLRFRLPFAVGPPTAPFNQNSDAARTQVYGDSAADESTGVGVVTFRLSFETGWSETLAVSALHSSSALRGEPDSLFPLNVPSAAARPLHVGRRYSTEPRPNPSLS